MVKKSLFIILFIYSLNNAQSGSATASVTANVVTPITIITTGSINFGDVVVMPISYEVIKSPAQGSRHEVQGNANSNITVTFNPVTLNNFSWAAQHGGATGTLNFIPEVKHTGTNPNYINPTSVVSGGVYQLTDVGGLGKIYLWVGGKIVVNANQPIGFYSGTFVINVAY